MKITEEQIVEIDQFIEGFGVKYIDVKIELIDHIASEIEEKINSEKLSFEDAMLIIKQKWTPMFTKQSSFWIGIIYSFPKIVLNKMENKVKRNTIIMFLLSFLFGFPMYYFKKECNFLLVPYLGIIDAFVFVLIFINLLVLVLVNYKPKHTTVRFLINQLPPNVLVFIILRINANAVGNLLQSLFILIATTLIVKYYIEHKNILKKYSL